MNDSLRHLPESKQNEILEITKIIKDIVVPEKIIFFGSYAKGNWVTDSYFEDGMRFEYFSDYDFLVVTKEDKEKEFVLTEKILARCRNRYSVPVGLLIHSIPYVNEGLSDGQYFFTEIINNGILLYDTGSFDFAPARVLTPKEQQTIAKRYYDMWFDKGCNFLIYTRFAFTDLLTKNKPLNDSVYLLHQATERFYSTTLLVFTGYKPKTHNLDKLRKYTKPLSYDLFKIFPFPTEDKREGHLFDLLKRGYLDARYKEDYTITKDELEILIDRIKRMQTIVEQICLTKIKSFTA